MRFLAFALFSLIFSFFLSPISCNHYLCVGCDILVGLVEKQAKLSNATIPETISMVCTDINSNGIFDWICKEYFSKYAPTIENDYSKGISPDFTCRTMKLCTMPQCNLWQTWPPTKGEEEIPRTELFDFSPPTEFYQPELDGPEWLAANPERKLKNENSGMHTISMLIGAIYESFGRAVISSKRPVISDSRWFSPLQRSAAILLGLEKEEENSKPYNYPLEDLDGDSFSSIRRLRGSDWRGKDCDDIDNSIYPGRRETTHGPSVDHNCNGISGTNANGQSYESLYCDTVPQYGIISIGDSATAHFTIPPLWLTTPLNNQSFHTLIPAAENSFDWPHCSWSTAHTNDSSECPAAIGPQLSIQSVYSHFRARNLCAHRDYQNLGVNGAQSMNTAPPSGYINGFSRSQSDQPAVIFYSLIGNDVCNNIGFSVMTPPEVFYNSTVESLLYLDSIVPEGSFVVLTGLVDGRILYEAVSHAIHPIGVSYPDFYNFLNCLQVSPCWGWMNTNATVRNLTTAHAQLLNQQYLKIIENVSFKNFQVKYFFFDVQKMLNQWISEGNNPLDLIARVDGFHPSQSGNYLWTEQLMDFLETEFPGAVPPINPANEAIIQQFGSALNGY